MNLDWVDIVLLVWASFVTGVVSARLYWRKRVDEAWDNGYREGHRQGHAACLWEWAHAKKEG